MVAKRKYSDMTMIIEVEFSLFNDFPRNKGETEYILSELNNIMKHSLEITFEDYTFRKDDDNSCILCLKSVDIKAPYRLYEKQLLVKCVEGNLSSEIKNCDVSIV